MLMVWGTVGCAVWSGDRSQARKRGQAYGLIWEIKYWLAQT